MFSGLRVVRIWKEKGGRGDHCVLWVGKDGETEEEGGNIVKIGDETRSFEISFVNTEHQFYKAIKYDRGSKSKGMRFGGRLDSDVEFDMEVIDFFGHLNFKEDEKGMKDEVGREREKLKKSIYENLQVYCVKEFESKQDNKQYKILYQKISTPESSLSLKTVDR